jgi:hypothetical protein
MVFHEYSEFENSSLHTVCADDPGFSANLRFKVARSGVNPTSANSKHVIATAVINGIVIDSVSAILRTKELSCSLHHVYGSYNILFSYCCLLLPHTETQASTARRLENPYRSRGMWLI